MKTMAEQTSASLRVELDVTPWWWKDPSRYDAKLVGRAVAHVLRGRLTRITATTEYLSISAHVPVARTLQSLEEGRLQMVAELDAMAPKP